MVPSRIVVLDELPLLPNGKLDLRGLSAVVASGAHGRRPPAGAETEARVIELWARALEVESVGGEDDFFELGGDSLAAAVIAAELHAAFGVELELRAFSEGSTPAAMARLVERLRAESGAVDDPPLVRVSRAGQLPLSFAQERTWSFSRTTESSSGYVMARTSQIRGPLDVGALRAAVAGIVARHEILRTTFAQSGGRPVQVVHPPADVDVPLIDLRGAPDPAGGATAMLTELANRPFDLERGPLVRFALVRAGGDEHQLLRAQHHA